MPDSIALAFAVCVAYILVFVELALVVIFYSQSRRPAWPGWLVKLSRKKRLVLVVIPGGVLLLRLALLPLMPVREPLVGDEHSYLLMADTFASGRATNPTHPMARYFETMHVMQRPTYASMYQPAQGAVLALGQVVFGRPWFGVCLSAGLMMAALLWMLYAWLPPRWALLGGSIACLRLGLFSYWMNSYWGGAPAAFGGALLLGSLGVMLRKPSASMGVVMGAGAAVLALSRPFEGAILCLGTGLVLIRKVRWPDLMRLVLPVTVTGAVGVALLGLYFKAVTGSATEAPEIVQRAPFAVAEIFYWQELRPEPSYPDRAMRDFYAKWERSEFSRPFWKGLGVKAISIWLFFFGSALTVPLIAAARVRSHPLYALLAISAFGFLLTPYFFAHYAAPATAAIIAVTIMGLRRVYAWRRAKRQGARLVWAVAAACFAIVPIRLLPNPAPGIHPFDWPMPWFWYSEGNVDRAKILRDLTRQGGKHLIVVRYGPSHQAENNEWVYNRADVDGARVVWGRDLGDAANAELIEYFRGRKTWVVFADEKPPRLEPYR